MLNHIYNQQITILNKLNRSDSTNGKDVWYKHTVNNAAWYEEVIRDVLQNGVAIGTVIKVLIPFNDEYQDYKEWKSNNDRSSFYTMSSGDYIILGDVTENVTSENVVAITRQYSHSLCTVKHVTKPHKRFGVNVQLKVEGI